MISGALVLRWRLANIATMGALMGPIRLLAAPIRHIAGSRLFQLAVVIVIILLVDYYSFDYAALRQISSGLQAIADSTVRFYSTYFRVGILTNHFLQVGVIIALVYAVCLIIAFVLRAGLRGAITFVGKHNVFWLRNAIARERGIAAYRAWLPLERIRPNRVSQEDWEEAYAWPSDNKPPYPPLARRLWTGIVSYLIIILVFAFVLQAFTPLTVLSWLGRLFKM